MNEVRQASFALDIVILLPLLGAFTVVLASRRWFGLKLALVASLSIYMLLTGITLFHRAAPDPTWHRDLIFGLGLVSVALWFAAAGFLLYPFSPHPYRKRILWTLNSYIVFLFWTLSGSMMIGYLDVTDLIPLPARNFLFAAGTPDWLRGPNFMWQSGTEQFPLKVFFIVLASLFVFGYNWLGKYETKSPESLLSVMLIKFLKLKRWHMIMFLLPVAAIFFPQLQTTWMKAVLFALYPVSLVAIGVVRIGYMFYGSYEKETGFFGNLENSVPPRR